MFPVQSVGGSPAQHLLTRRRVDAIKGGTPGDVLTDEQLESLIGKRCAPGHKGYSYLASAIRFVVRTHGVHWHRLRGASCIKCSAGSESLEISKGDIAGVKRRMKRTGDVMATIKMNELAPELKASYLATAVQVGTLSQFASATFRKGIEARGATTAPRVEDVLKLFAAPEKP